MESQDSWQAEISKICEDQSVDEFRSLMRTYSSSTMTGSKYTELAEDPTLLASRFYSLALKVALEKNSLTIIRHIMEAEPNLITADLFHNKTVYSSSRVTSTLLQLIDEYLDPTWRSRVLCNQCSQKETAFHKAWKLGKYNPLLIDLSQEFAEIHGQDGDPLLHFVLKSHIEINGGGLVDMYGRPKITLRSDPQTVRDAALRLIDIGCDVNEEDASGDTPLTLLLTRSLAGEQISIDVLLALIAKGARLPASHMDAALHVTFPGTWRPWSWQTDAFLGDDLKVIRNCDQFIMILVHMANNVADLRIPSELFYGLQMETINKLNDLGYLGIIACNLPQSRQIDGIPGHMASKHQSEIESIVSECTRKPATLKQLTRHSLRRHMSNIKVPFDLTKLLLPSELEGYCTATPMNVPPTDSSLSLGRDHEFLPLLQSASDA